MNNFKIDTMDFFLLKKAKRFYAVCFFLAVFFSFHTQAATYTLTSGSYPPCNTSWSVSGANYTCTGNGRVTLASGDVLAASTTVNIFANNGFALNNNNIGSSSANINLTSSYGTVTSAGANTLYGFIQGGSGAITLVGTNVSGTVTTSGAVNLTGGNVTGLVTSSSNTITASNTDLPAGASAQSGMTIAGGVLGGAFTMTSNNVATFSNVIMTSGSISGASTVSISGSTLGSSGSSITISSNSGAISLSSTTVYGNLTAPSYSTINVASGSLVTGSCLPNSTPANACNVPPTCTTGLIGGLAGSYFNNMTLSGNPTGARRDSSVNFDWGTGTAGVSGIGADNFSVRWTGSLRAPSTGSYQFQTLSDDGVRLWINNTLVIDNWTNHSVTTNTSTSVNLVAGQAYPVKLEFYENGGYAVMKLNWSQPTNSSFAPIDTQAGVVPDTSASCAVPVITCDSGFIGGVTGKYFNNTSLTGSPTDTRLDAAIDFNWGNGSPGATGIGVDNFSVRWDGTVKVATTGSYQFETVSDDGVRLWVNNVLVIDNWTYHSATSNTTSGITLTAGANYPVRVEFFEGGGSAVIQLHWKKPSDSAYSTLNSCPSTISAYTITASTTAITCAGEPITFTAVDNSGGSITPPSGTNVTLSTTPATATWAGGNTYSFNGSTSSFIKYLQQTTPATITMGITDGTNTGSKVINFVDSALKFYGDSSGLATISNQFAGQSNNSPVLKAIRTDSVTGACVAQVIGTKSVNLAYECVNPTVCISGQVFSVNGASIKSNAKNASIVYSSQNLTFDNTGSASIPLNYSDVGLVTIYGQVSLPATTNDPQKTLIGSSNSFVVKPYTLVVSTAQTATGGVNPAGSSAAGVNQGFVAAGAPFQVKVEARKFPGTATTDITPNFGNEVISESNIKLLASSLVYPIGGTLTSLTGTTAFSATTPAGTWLNGGVVWDQVGSITIRPELADSDYLTAGDIAVKSPSGTIGRFYPDHYRLESSALTNSCGSFSYIGQPLTLTYSLKAESLGGTVLTNYGVNYATTTPTYVAENADDGNGVIQGFAARINSGAAVVWSNGVFNLATTAAGFVRKPPLSAPDGPFADLKIGIVVSDSFDFRGLQSLDMNAATTGVCGAACDAKLVGSSLNMRYGRLRLDDAFGPETYPLKVNFATEYWTGSYFSLNTSDSCTQVVRSVIAYPAGPISTDSNRTVSLTGGSTQGTYINLNPTYVGFNAGTAGQQFASPAGGTGRFVVGVDLTTMPWLRFDWNQDGDFSDIKLPNATFEFGSYRGNDRIIYWREKLQ